MLRSSSPRQPAIFASYPHDSHLSVEIRHQAGRFALDIEFNLKRPWTILFGPSGSGKSTLLRIISGLVRPDFGRIISCPRPVSSKKTGDTLGDTSVSIWLPPHQRGTSLAAQRPALFPHMTVLENIRYGYPAVGSSGEQEYLDDLMAKIPRLFRINELLDKRAGELSGGEAQRVSLARAAMARDKRILLLDEPFSGLDLPLRDTLIANLLAWQELFRTPILSVTHDVGEAFQLGAEVIKIADGKVVQQGPVEVVLAEERAELLRQLNGVVGSRD